MRIFIATIAGILLASLALADENYDLILKAERQHIELSDDDKDVLKNGDLGAGRYVLGGIVGTYPGLGVGHAVQGRWGTKGWIFTAGETTSLLVALGGLISMDSLYDSDGLAIYGLGVLAYSGFHIWEIIDVWHGGYKQRKEYDYLKKKINGADAKKLSWFVVPHIDKDNSRVSVGVFF